MAERKQKKITPETRAKMREARERSVKIPRPEIDLGTVRILADDDQWILQRKKTSGKWDSDDQSYYRTVGSALKDVLEFKLRRVNANTIDDLLKAHAKVCEELLGLSLDEVMKKRNQ
jgi:hypothetical protein